MPMFISLLLFLLAIPSLANAEDLYVNGLRLSGSELAGQVLRNVEEVVFDESGDVHIIAPTHTIAIDPAVARERRSESAMRLLLGGSYFVVVQRGGDEQLPVEVTLQVNGEEVSVVASQDLPFVQEVTGLLQLGQNTLTVRTRPESTIGSGASGNVMVVMGEGTVLDTGAVRIDRRHVSLTVPANELRREREQERSVELEYRSASRR